MVAVVVVVAGAADRKDTCRQYCLPCTVTLAVVVDVVVVSSVCFVTDHSRCPVDGCVDVISHSMNIHDVYEHISRRPINTTDSLESVFFFHSCKYYMVDLSASQATHMWADFTQKFSTIV